MSWRLVGGIVDGGAEHISAQPLDAGLRLAARGLHAAAGRGGGGAGDGQPVGGAVRVPDPRHARGARRRDREAVHVGLARRVADTAESPLVTHTDGVFLV